MRGDAYEQHTCRSPRSNRSPPACWADVITTRRELLGNTEYYHNASYLKLDTHTHTHMHSTRTRHGTGDCRRVRLVALYTCTMLTIEFSHYCVTAWYEALRASPAQRTPIQIRPQRLLKLRLAVLSTNKEYRYPDSNRRPSAC